MEEKHTNPAGRALAQSSSMVYALITAPLVCDEFTCMVLTRISQYPVRDVDAFIRGGGLTLDDVYRIMPMRYNRKTGVKEKPPKSKVFAAVAKLEEAGLIPESCIR